MMAVPCCMYGQEQISLDRQFSLGSPTLSIRLPGNPEPLETRIQPSMLEIIAAYYAYAYIDSVRDITVMLLQTSYAQHIHPDMSIVSDQTIRELESRGALSIKYKTKAINIEGKKGIRQKGTLVSNGDSMDFTSSILQEENNVWKIIIYSRAGDAIAAQTTQAILNSISFKEQ